MNALIGPEDPQLSRLFEHSTDLSERMERLDKTLRDHTANLVRLNMQSEHLVEYCRDLRRRDRTSIPPRASLAE